MASEALELMTRRRVWDFEKAAFVAHFMFQCIGATAAHPSLPSRARHQRSGSALRVIIVKQGNKWRFIAPPIIVNRHLTGPSSDIYNPVGSVV